MSRRLVIALLISLLLHGGAALSGYFFKKPPAPRAAAPVIPTIALYLPPLPPEEPEPIENTSADAPPEAIAPPPPMQTDAPSAVIDSPFVQQIQAPPPPNLARPSAGIVIPANTRPSLGADANLGNIFDLAALDQKPEARLRIKPIYPFEMRRSGLSGEVVVGFIVDRQGEVRDPAIIHSTNPGFDDAAIQAVLKWKFKPGKKGGAAVNTRVAQPLSFSLNAE